MFHKSRHFPNSVSFCSPPPGLGVVLDESHTQEWFYLLSRCFSSYSCDCALCTFCGIYLVAKDQRRDTMGSTTVPWPHQQLESQMNPVSRKIFVCYRVTWVWTVLAGLLRHPQQIWTISCFSPTGDLKDVAIEELQQQLRDMMFHLETQQQIEHLLPEARSEIQEGQINIAAGPTESGAGAGPSSGRGRRGRGRKRK